MAILAIFGEQASPREKDGILPTLRIGDLAKATGKTTRALRLYEELGLLLPDERSSGGFRQYTQTAIDRVHWISKLQALGFTLQDIKILLLTASEEEVPRDAMNHVQNIFQEKLVEVSDQLKRLETLKNELSSTLEYLDGCNTCTAEDAGTSNCISCTEHEQDESPSLLLEVTKASIQLLQNDSKLHLAPRGSK